MIGRAIIFNTELPTSHWCLGIIRLHGRTGGLHVQSQDAYTEELKRAGSSACAVPELATKISVLLMAGDQGRAHA